MTKHLKPAWARPKNIALVFLGGCVGTLARAWLSATFPAAKGTFCWATFTINLTGAFALALLTGITAFAINNKTTRENTRLLLGTGAMGGYTTYSTLMVDTLKLGSQNLTLASAYLAATIIGGFITAYFGFWLAGAIAKKRGGDA